MLPWTVGVELHAAGHVVKERKRCNPLVRVLQIFILPFVQTRVCFCGGCVYCLKGVAYAKQFTVLLTHEACIHEWDNARMRECLIETRILRLVTTRLASVLYQCDNATDIDVHLWLGCVGSYWERGRESARLLIIRREFLPALGPAQPQAWQQSRSASLNHTTMKSSSTQISHDNPKHTWHTTRDSNRLSSRVSTSCCDIVVRVRMSILVAHTDIQETWWYIEVLIHKEIKEEKKKKITEGWKESKDTKKRKM